MRPVNLIPPEDRRGEQAPLRIGPLAYILRRRAGRSSLVGVTALVLTGNQITERKAKSRPLTAAKTRRRRQAPTSSPPTRSSAT